MRCFSTVPIVIFGVIIAFAVGSFAAPSQTHAAGLDFWNYADEWAGFRDTETAGHDLDFGLEQAQLRNTVSDDIAASLCDDRITMTEAITAIGAIMENSPDWSAQLQAVYRRRGTVAPTATEHDVQVRYLRTRIESLIWKAEAVGDTARATTLSARLDRFDREMCE